MFEILLQKESFKFSSSHFTIFSEKTAERLHGHNYKVTVTIKISQIDPKIGMAFDFNEVKPRIQKLCDSWDEKFLIPIQSPYLKIKNTNQHTEISFGDKKYVLPDSDIVSLPIPNITTECLAEHFAKSLNLFQDFKNLVSLKVTVFESLGQASSYKLKN